jgi:hypothetical protein
MSDKLEKINILSQLFLVFQIDVTHFSSMSQQSIDQQIEAGTGDDIS